MTIRDLLDSSCRWFEGRSPRRSGVPMTTRQLRITPRDAAVTIVADPTLDLPYSAAWSGAAPTIEEQDGAIEFRYGLGARLRSLLPRPRSLRVALAPTAVWKIELHGGVSALRADLRQLRVSAIALKGDAHDVAFELPAPRAELALTVDGAVAGASVRRPAHVPVDVEIDGGAHELSLDGVRLVAIAGLVRQRTQGGAKGGEVAVRIRGAASELTVAAHEAR
jgi:hypothetical protein